MEYVFRPVVTWPTEQANFLGYLRQTEAKARRARSASRARGEEKNTEKITLVRKPFFKLFLSVQM